MPIDITRTDVTVAGLRDAVNAKKLGGRRLVQICCTKGDGFELIYSFDNNTDKQHGLENLHLHLDNDGIEVESVSDLFGFAFLYENEIKELFGIKIVNITLDFGGNLYQTKHKRVFNPESQGEGGN